MEFFERAHMPKGNSSRKDNKSDENVKKQLKQMLYGYKQSDIELIKSSADMKKDFDDSTSVSGFSDLNLTNSSFEGDILHEAQSPNHKDLSSFDISEVSLTKSPNNVNIDNKENQSASTSVNIESISETDDIQSLSEYISSETHDNWSTSEDDDDCISHNSSFLPTSGSETDQSEPFDADGALAAKILKRLSNQKTKITDKHRKIKDSNKGLTETLKTNCKEDFTYKGPYRPKDIIDMDIDMEEIKNFDSVKLPKSKVYRGPLRHKDSSEEITDTEDSESEHNSAIDSDESSPFVSVMTTDMPNQSLEDILGEYKHSTMKNLPSDSHNADFSTHSTGLEDATVTDLEIEEDVDSLVPEVDNVALDDIIDLETEMDTSAPPNDESILHDETLQSEQTSERELSTESIDATLINPVKVYYGKNNCIFVLKHPAKIHIHGKVKVKALGGTVEVLGYTLLDKTYEVYAPHYNYAQYLRTVKNQNIYYGLFGKLTAAGLTVSEAEDIVTTLGDYDGVISMQPLRSRKLDFIESNFTVTDLFSKTSKQVDNCFRKASELLDCSLYLSRPWKCFHENAIWKQVISCGFDGPSRGVVCGGKGAGKSTFLRYYVNKLLAQGPVLVVDLDPGQCEFTAAGNVSATVVTEPMLGPNFTHLRTPEIMLNIGMINPMDSPRRYANAVRELISHCSSSERLAAMPWIVNTMGMTNTMGLKFISLAILQTKPTFVLQIDSKNSKKGFDSHLHSNFMKQQYFEHYQNDVMFRHIGDVDSLEYSFFVSPHMDNSGRNNFSLAPRDERYLSFLAYFGELMNMHSCDLLGIVPYEVNLRDLSVGTNVKVCAASLKQVLNGKVVALCEHEEPSHNKLFALTDRPLRCCGLGLIRGIDWERGVLYVITPAEVARASALVYADWAPEVRGQEARLPAGTPAPYRTASQYQRRQLMFAPRRRFNPLQLLKMSRNA